MEDSILTGTKKNLGIVESYTAFDHDITTHINSTFSHLNQLGIGPDDGFEIEDAEAKWEELGVEKKVESMIRTYVYLKVRMLFDPPTMSFLIESMNNQIKEHEHRLLYYREFFDQVAEEV